MTGQWEARDTKVSTVVASTASMESEFQSLMVRGKILKRNRLGTAFWWFLLGFFVNSTLSRSSFRMISSVVCSSNEGIGSH